MYFGDRPLRSRSITNRRQSSSPTVSTGQLPNAGPMWFLMYDRYVCREKSVARSRPRRCSATFSTVIACDAWRARCWAAAFSSPRTDSIRSRHSSARDLSRHVLDLLRPSWSYQTTLYEVLVGRARVSMLAMPSVYACEGIKTRSEGIWPGIMPTFPHDSGPPAGGSGGI